MVIDLHTHIFPPEIAEQRDTYVERDPCFAELYSSPKSTLATAEDLIASMDESGIDMSAALNFAWSSHELCMQTNDYILEAARRHPGRLIPFCTIEPQAPEARAEVKRCAAGGARGLGEMRPDVQGFESVDPEAMDAIVNAAVEHDLVFLTHASEPVGHRYPGKGTATPGVLCSFIARYPQLKVVCAHWGGGLPFYTLMPEVRDSLVNTYFDTAATHLLYRPSVFQRVVDLIGPYRVLFGSDFPLVAQSRAASEVRAAGLGPEAMEAILGANAQRLLGLDRHPVRHALDDTSAGGTQIRRG